MSGVLEGIVDGLIGIASAAISIGSMGTLAAPAIGGGVAAIGGADAAITASDAASTAATEGAQAVSEGAEVADAAAPIADQAGAVTNAAEGVNQLSGANAEGTSNFLPNAKTVGIGEGGSAATPSSVVGGLPGAQSLPNSSSLPLSQGGSALSNGAAPTANANLTQATNNSAQNKAIAGLAGQVSKIGASLMSGGGKPNAPMMPAQQPSGGAIVTPMPGLSSVGMPFSSGAPLQSNQIGGSILPMAAPPPLAIPAPLPMMATSDFRTKINVVKSNEELNDLLNNVYNRVISKRKFK